MLNIRINNSSTDPEVSDYLSLDIHNNTFAGVYGRKRDKVLAVLAGLKNFDGDIVLDSISLKGDIEEYRNQIAVLTKESVVNTSLSVNDYLDLFGFMSNSFNEKYEERKNWLLKEFGLQDFANISVNYLTERNRKIIKLMSIFLKEHSLVLIDAFIESFHIEERNKIIQFLKRYAFKDRIVLIGSDDYTFLESFSDDIIVLD